MPRNGICRHIHGGELNVTVTDEKLHIDQEGIEKKFIKQVEQKTFSGYYAIRMKKTVLFVTERCVFKLAGRGMELIEIAPGSILKRISSTRWVSCPS